MESAIVMGVGPLNGLGAKLCQRFASRGLHVFVAGRTQSNLDAVVAIIKSEGGQATACLRDASIEDDVQALFDLACESTVPTLAIYNAGNNTPGSITEMDADYFRSSWETGCFGGFLFSREAARRMLANGRGTILFTGASASLRGKANFGAFNSAKAGLRSLAQALAKEVGPEGIHVAHVVIDGAINGDKIHSRFPEYAEKLGDAGMINLDGIVDAYEYLHKQGRSSWSFELDLRTAIENW